MTIARRFLPQVLSITVLFVGAGPLWAQTGGKPILVRSHAGDLDRDSLQHLDAFARILGQHRALMGAALSKAMEARVSRPPGTLSGTDDAITRQVNSGRRAFVDGDFQRAVKLLEPARRALMNAEGRLSSNQSLRGALHTALLMLGHTYLRLKKPERATEAVSEAIRSFPDRDLSLVKYAPELVQFYKKVRLQLRRQDRATLRVTTEPAGCLVFINGRYAGLSPARVADLYAGRYSVYVQSARERGRVHQVIMDGSERQLSINFGLDSVLRSGGHLALHFSDAQQMNQKEVRYAASVARAVGASRVILVGVRTLDSGRVLRGTLVSTDGTRVVRSGSISLEPAAPSPATLRSLVDFLFSGKETPEVTVQGRPGSHKDGETVAATATDRQDDGGPGAGWMGLVKWVALGVAVAGLGAGIPLIAMDGSGTCDSGGRCPEQYETLAPGVAATAVGGVAAVGAVVLFVLDARGKKKTKQRAAVTPLLLPGGVGLGAMVRF